MPLAALVFGDLEDGHDRRRMHPHAHVHAHDKTTKTRLLLHIAENAANSIAYYKHDKYKGDVTFWWDSIYELLYWHSLTVM